MNRLYRISALALAAALCLALAACGSRPASTGSTSGGGSSSVSTPAASGSGSVSGSASVSSGGAGDTMSEGQRYAYAIRDARPAEDNEYSEIACGDAGGEPMLAVNPNGSAAECTLPRSGEVIYSIGEGKVEGNALTLAPQSFVVIR